MNMEAIRNLNEESRAQHEKNPQNSSPENSPRIEIDTSVELNGGKSDNQQFCLRWNNHQVSPLTQKKKSNFFSLIVSIIIFKRHFN